MKSSSTASWNSHTKQKLLNGLGTGGDEPITSSTRELVEFYWTNQKRFSGGYRGFPSNLN
tara:strand:- start:1079 stop:1258 length:180 start_codon:yes stop_codon:yes gene_type:complete